MWCVLATSGLQPPAVAARSTVVAQLVSPAIAGPELDQTANLYLRYFPGDGEAIRAVELAPDPARLSLQGGTSALGQVAVHEGVLRVEYADRPLASEAADTVALRVRARRGGEVGIDVNLYSSAADTAAQAVHLTVQVTEPLGVGLTVTPHRAYQGQRVPVQVELRNLDGQGRGIDAVELVWPTGVAAQDGPVALAPLAAGEVASAGLSLTVDAGTPAGILPLRGALAGAGLSSSPLPAVEFTVLPGLVAEIVPAGPAAVGGEVSFEYVVRNPGGASLDVASIAVEIPAGCSDVALVGMDEAPVDSQGRLVLSGPAQVGPGEEVRAAVRFRPGRAGPMAWNAWYAVAGHDALLPSVNTPVVDVLLGDGAGSPGVGESLLTDVGAVTQTLTAALSEAVAELPADLAAPLELVPDDASQKKNWVVEEALSAVLMDAGYRLQLDGESGSGAAELHYRLLSSRVVYTSRRSGWNPFASGQERRTVAHVLLRLVEPDGDVPWARRVRSSRADAVPGDAGDWLGGGKGVDRAEVPADFRVLELGLSGMIVGGLMFVFFVP